MILKKDKRFYWILFGVGTIVIRICLLNAPHFVERVYSRGLFQVIRFIFDWTIGWLPIPLLYVIVLFVPFWLIWKLIGNVRKESGILKKAYTTLISLLAFASGVIALFLWLWGFNYLRVPIEKQIGMELQPLSESQLKEELDIFTARTIRHRAAFPSEKAVEISPDLMPADLEKQIQLTLRSTMLQLGYPAARNLPVRQLFKGSLLRIGTAGFYLPFTGECNLDAGLHPLQQPYVMAHEMAHGMGITDEGSCNFIAYLSCSNSTDPYIRYSGILSFWRTLAVNYRVRRPEIYTEYRAALPAGIIADLDAINENSNKYPDLFPELRDRTYDAFLKTQGIKEGAKNYNRVLVLERAWRLKKE